MGDPEPDSVGPEEAPRIPAARGARRRDLHPEWCQLHGPAEFGGTEHVSGLALWRPTYQHEVSLMGWVRHVIYPDASRDTPAAVVRIDNADQPGEIAMAADDLAACAERLLRLRDLLISASVPESCDSLHEGGQSGELQSERVLSGNDSSTPTSP